MLICWGKNLAQRERWLHRSAGEPTAAAHQGAMHNRLSGSRFLLLAAFTIAIHGDKKRQTNFLLAVSPLFKFLQIPCSPHCLHQGVAHPQCPVLGVTGWWNTVSEKGGGGTVHWWKDWPWLGWRDLLLTRRQEVINMMGTNMVSLKLIAGSWKSCHQMTSISMRSRAQPSPLWDAMSHSLGLL